MLLFYCGGKKNVYTMDNFVKREVFWTIRTVVLLEFTLYT